MPEPFKNFFNPALVRQMAAHIANIDPQFDAAGFTQLALKDFETLELKARSNQISGALDETLSRDFPTACDILCNALHPEDDVDLSELSMDDRGIRGWAIMPLADYIARNGQHHFDLAMDVLQQMTRRFSAEFAVRPFFAADPSRALGHAKNWAKHSNYHVRRLASEGARPRLPWGLQLKGFIKDPAPLLPILTALKDDESEYVRRSVANNLNDISKDHPDWVAAIAADWMQDAPKNRQRLVRHGCRSLIKSGHKPTLRALGYTDPKLHIDHFEISPDALTLGGTLTLRVSLTSTSPVDQPLIVDYIIHHVKADGRRTPKVFKWKVTDLDSRQSLTLTKRHTIKPITTRIYYSGTHIAEILINGVSCGEQAFHLDVP